MPGQARCGDRPAPRRSPRSPRWRPGDDIWRHQPLAAGAKATGSAADRAPPPLTRTCVTRSSSKAAGPGPAACVIAPGNHPGSPAGCDGISACSWPAARIRQKIPTRQKTPLCEPPTDGAGRTVPVKNGGLVCGGSPGSGRRVLACLRRAGVIIDVMTGFLIGYVVGPGAGLAGDPGLKASQQSAGGALSVLENNQICNPR
jgi:hypothetical protein